MKKRINIDISEQLWRRVGIRAAELGIAKRNLVEEALENYLGGNEVKNETYYLVQMVKGTDNSYDETSQPRTLLKTTDKKAALDFYETLPEWVALEEPETDLEGREKYESPVVVEVSSDTRTMIRG